MSYNNFDFIGGDIRGRVEAGGHIRHFSPGQIVYLQEDNHDCVYVVRSGYVRLSYLLEDGASAIFSIVPPGQCFGEVTLFDSKPHPEMAMAIRQCSILCIPNRYLRDLMKERAALNDHLSRILACRCRNHMAMLRMLSMKRLSARLSQCLLILAEQLNERVELPNSCTPMRIGSCVTQTDLGLMARGARGNVNKLLKYWERNGWILLQSRSVLLLDPGALRRLAYE